MRVLLAVVIFLAAIMLPSTIFAAAAATESRTIDAGWTLRPTDINTIPWFRLVGGPPPLLECPWFADPVDHVEVYIHLKDGRVYGATLQWNPISN